MPDPAFASPEVAEKFDAAPALARAGMLALRRLILGCAVEMPEVGQVEEALRWGQPAYLARRGSTLRIGETAEGFALYAHCRTSIISDFAEAFPGMDRIEGTRAVHFRAAEEVDPDRHGQLVRHALGYHLKR